MYLQGAALYLFVWFAPLAQCQNNLDIPDFTFLQASDIHTPMVQSSATLAQIQNIGEISLDLFNITAPKPSFLLLTGDLTEFGGGNGWWNAYQAYVRAAGLPAYPVLETMIQPGTPI